MRTRSGCFAGLLVLALLAGCEGWAGTPPDETPYAGTRLPDQQESIAFVCFLTDDEDSGALYRVAASGRLVQALAPGVRDARLPRWSADGRKIVFQADRSGPLWSLLNLDGDEELYSVDADGSGLQQLTNNWNDDLAPVWSPDGQSIAFVHRDVFAGTALQRMRADGSDLRTLTTGLNLDRTAAWSPDGAQVAFAAVLADDQRELDVVGADGLHLKSLTRDTAMSNLVWSTDGRWIRYDTDDGATVRVGVDGAVKEYLHLDSARKTASWSTERPAPSTAHPVNPSQWITLLRPVDFGVRAVVGVPVDATSVTESPDGQWIAYTSRDYGTGVVSSQVFRMRLDGSGLQQLTSMDCNAFDPQWSPDTTG